MKNILFFVILLLIQLDADCQNLIGNNSREIKEYMKNNCRQMNFEKVTNNIFKYLKYSDNYGSQTILFFLNKDSVCSNVRFICDTGIKDHKVKEFDSIYKSDGINKWYDIKDGNKYLIEMKDEEWSCVITIEQNK